MTYLFILFITFGLPTIGVIYLAIYAFSVFQKPNQTKPKDRVIYPINRFWKITFTKDKK